MARGLERHHAYWLEEPFDGFDLNAPARLAAEVDILITGGELGKRFLKVKDLMRTGDRIPMVARDTAMAEAIHEMSRKMMGITAIVDGGGELLGVISDGDLRRLLEKDLSLLSRTAAECLHANPRTIDAETFASTALSMMEEAKITSLFVVDEKGRLTGALHMHDLLSAGIS